MSESSGQNENFGLKNYPGSDSFGAWLGYQVDELDRENQLAKLSLKIRGDHSSPAGRVHGGVVSAFLDFACGAAVFSTMNEEDLCSTVELKVNYLRPIDLDDTLWAQTQVVYNGKRLCVVQGSVWKNEDTEPVAIASSTFNVVRKKFKKGKGGSP